MEEKKYKKLAFDTMLFAVGTLGSKMIMFFLMPVYTNVLSEGEYGTADLVFTVSEIVLPFISLAIYNGLHRYTLSKDENENDVLLCATIFFIAGSFLAVAITPVISLYDAVSEWKRFVILYVVSFFASNNVLVYLKAKDRNRLYAVLSILRALLLVSTNIILLIVWNEGIRGYLFANIFATAAIAVIGFLTGEMHKDLARSHFSLRLMRQMAVYSLPFIVNDVSWWLIHASDKIMIGNHMDTAALGLYSAAAKIPLFFKVVAGIFGQAWDLSVVREYEGDNSRKYYSTIYRYYMLLVFGICIVMVPVMKPFILIYFGKNFKAAWQYIPLLLAAECFGIMDSFTNSFFRAMKKSHIIMYPTLIAGVINLFVNRTLIPVYGVWGAVVGTVAAYFVMMVIHSFEMWRYYRLDMQLIRFMLFAVMLIIQAAMVSFERHIVGASIAAAVIYLIAAYKDIVILTRLILEKVRKGKWEKI